MNFVEIEMVNQLLIWKMDLSRVPKLRSIASKAQLEKEQHGKSLVKTVFGVGVLLIAVRIFNKNLLKS